MQECVGPKEGALGLIFELQIDLRIALSEF